jgi:hypothetical protein
MKYLDPNNVANLATALKDISSILGPRGNKILLASGATVLFVLGSLHVDLHLTIKEKFAAETAKINAETAKLNAETAKINAESEYIRMKGIAESQAIQHESQTRSISKRSIF